MIHEVLNRNMEKTALIDQRAAPLVKRVGGVNRRSCHRAIFDHAFLIRWYNHIMPPSVVLVF